MTSTPPGDVVTPPEPTHGLSNITMRVITALLTLPIVLIGALVGDWLFALLVGIIVVFGTLEFHVLARGRLSQGSAVVGVPAALLVVLAFYWHQDGLWIAALVGGAVATFVLEQFRHPAEVRRSLIQVAATLAGILYVAFPAAFLVAIRDWPNGLAWLLTVFAVTWGTDTFAYFGGRFFGRHKLVPRLSPKKTVEGAIIGIIGGIIPAVLILGYADLLTVAAFIVVCIGPLVAIAGDLFESGLKRFFKVKDSHVPGLDIFPGHGGALDRVDALIMVSAFVYIFVGIGGAVG